MFLRWIGPFYSASDGGTGDGDSDGAGDVKPSDVVNRYGTNGDSALRLAEKVADLENKLYRLREKNRTLTTDLETTRARLPADGTVTLAKADADALDAYRALGPAADLKTALDAKGIAETELSGLKREKVLTKAAEAAGFKASVLSSLAGDLDIQTKADKDGKPLAIVLADGKETPLADYAAQRWPDFMPALAPKAPGDGVGSPANGTRPRTAPGDLLIKPRATI